MSITSPHSSYSAAASRSAERVPIDPESLFESLQNPAFLPSYKEAVTAMRLGLTEAIAARAVFEIWNKEYIAGLTAQLVMRAEIIGASEEQPLRILEIGAGDGRLSHFVREQSDAAAPGTAHVVATDSHTWNIPPVFPVEGMGCEEALQTYKPHVVLCSWMPYRQDFTAVMRAEDSVQTYILIGEASGDSCGDPWRTWGQSHDIDDSVPPYAADGFEQTELDALSDLQISRTRWINLGGRETSSTVAFTRLPASSS